MSADPGVVTIKVKRFTPRGHEEFSRAEINRLETGRTDADAADRAAYAADLSEYRAAVHAASDRQRKLDAVKAAEVAHEAQKRASEAARSAAWEAEHKTARALDAARREAGL